MGEATGRKAPGPKRERNLTESEEAETLAALGPPPREWPLRGAWASRRALVRMIARSAGRDTVLGCRFLIEDARRGAPAKPGGVNAEQRAQMDAAIKALHKGE